MVAQVADDSSVSWKLGVSTSEGNLWFPLHWIFGFLVGMKLGVSNRLSCYGSTISGRDFADFVDVFEDNNELRCGRI
jgi:hypothetical protein